MREMHLIAHDIRSRENVGSLFRTCDSLGVKKLWLTGYTPAPPDDKISKVALGADQSVEYEKAVDVVEVMKKLKENKIPVYALELTPEAVELSSFVRWLHGSCGSTELTEVRCGTLIQDSFSESCIKGSASASPVKPSCVAVLLGTETTGIPPSLLELCDGAVKITQRGIKESMNVSVAAGIAAWAILNSRGE